MNLRTDLAIEQREICQKSEPEGIEQTVEKLDEIKITQINVKSKSAEDALKRKKGRYITVELPGFAATHLFDSAVEIISAKLKSLLPKDGLILVAGLGNENITPDALGPVWAAQIFSTRHIDKELQKSAGFENLRPVARITPGVLGQNGIETGEIIAGIVKQISPAALITVDALAARNAERLGRTVQMCNTGIVPGSGVGNARQEISRRTVGVPVVSIGVPTVVDAAAFVTGFNGDEPESAGSGMMVTPKEVDLMIERASKLTSLAINCALQPHISPEDMLILTA
jgi:spore protease